MPTFMRLPRNLHLGLAIGLALLLWIAVGGHGVRQIASAPEYANTEVRAISAADAGGIARRRLLLPVVFHLQRSRRWRSPESLTGVLAEMQRIFEPAGIELQPRFAPSAVATSDIDIYLVPQVWQRGRSVNGISFSRGAREIFVRDDVVLRQIPDGRPRRPLPLPKYWQEQGIRGRVRVGAEQAEQARTIAHELGHQLGLFHRPEWEFLEASGTTGWRLDRREIDVLRRTAIARFGARAIS